MGSIEHYERKLIQTNPPANPDVLKRWWQKMSEESYKAHQRYCPVTEEKVTAPEGAAGVGTNPIS